MSPTIHPVALLAEPEDEGPLVAAINAQDELEVVRRCADLAEVVAAARSGAADFVCVDGQDPDLDARLVEDLVLAGAGVVILGDRADLLSALGADAVVSPRSCDQVVEALLSLARQDRALRARGGLGIPSAPSLPVGFPSLGEEIAPATSGHLVAVWGTSGAPGRSTSAITIARLTSRKERTLLLDADTANPAIAHMLSLPVDPSGLAALARSTARGPIGPEAITKACLSVEDGFSVLTGLGTPQRWKEIGPAGIVDILQAARRVSPTIVVDLPAVTLDPVDPQERHTGSRDETCAAVLRHADTVVLVARGDAVGLHRLSLAYQWWKDCGFSAHLLVCINRCSQAAAGPTWVNAIRSALSPFLQGHTVYLIPEDQTVGEALLRGRAVSDYAPQSPASCAWADVAEAVRTCAGRAARPTHPVRH